MVDTRRGPGGRLADVIHERAIPILVCMSVGALALSIFHIDRAQSDLIHTNALRSAHLYTQALAEFRSLYTAEVVDRVRSRGIEAVHDYRSREGTIPLPATLSMELGKRIGAHEAGVSARLYSPYPFPWRKSTGGLRDDFARQAWARLTSDRKTPFYRFETQEGRLFLRYATADLMRAKCVSCHNSHPQSPKTDWKVGDVRGVLEVVQPLDQIVASASASLKGTSLVLALLVGLILLILGFVITAYRRGSIELEKRVRERTIELTESEARTSAIMNGAADGIITTDEHGIVGSYNAAARTIFGHESEEVIGCDFSMLMPAPDGGRQDEDLASFLQEGARRIDGNGREVLGQRKDGSTFPMEIRVSEVMASSQRVFMVILRDITERKLAEEKLRAEKDYTDNIVRSMVNMLIVVAPDGEILTVNDATCRTLGHETEELVGRPARMLFSGEGGRREEECSDFVLPREALPLGRPALRSLVEEGAVSGIALSLLTSSGTEISVLTSWSVMWGSDGKIAGVLCVAEDISERERAEMVRQRLEAQLAQAQKLESVGQLAAGIAHEINTPAQYVGDNTRFLQDAFGEVAKVLEVSDELLEAVQEGTVSEEMAGKVGAVIEEADLEYLGEEIPKAIQESLEGIERVTKIVRAMKEFSHPGVKEKTPTDLNQAIESTVTVATSEWKYVAEMVLQLDEDLPLVPCLPGELNQVVLNLIVNAAHAIGDAGAGGGGEKGTITVSTRRDGEWAEIRVGDTGTGIPEDARQRVFDPFFTTKAVGKGTGQGLSMAHGVVVKKHGGTISFETELGKGTTFVIRLPLTGAGAPAEETRA